MVSCQLSLAAPEAPNESEGSNTTGSLSNDREFSLYSIYIDKPFDCSRATEEQYYPKLLIYA